MSAARPPRSTANPEGRSLRGWRFHVLRTVIIAAGLTFLVVSAAFGLLIYLMSGGNPGLSKQLVVLWNPSVGTDSTRFELGRVFGTLFFFSSRRRHTRCLSDWSSDVCSSD